MTFYFSLVYLPLTSAWASVSQVTVSFHRWLRHWVSYLSLFLSSADLCAGFGELDARPFPSTVTKDDLRLALDSLRRISSLFSTFPGRAEDALLCVSLAGLELTIVFERGSITGIRVRGLEPKEALLDTVGGPGLEPTGPLELKRLLVVEDSPCPPALEDLREPVVTLFLRFWSVIPEPTSLGEFSPLTLFFRIDEEVGLE